MTALVNTISLASELAEIRLIDNWTSEDSMIITGVENTHYTPEAQKIFDAYYDEYLTVIERSQYTSSKHV